MTTHEKILQLIRAADEEGRLVCRYRANGAEYILITRADGWIQIVDATDPGELRPMIEARDRQHAESFCELTEPLRVPVQLIAPDRPR